LAWISLLALSLQMAVKKVAPMTRPTATIATSRTVVRGERRFSFGEALAVVMASSSEV